MIEKYPGYFQKSTFFLYPLLGLNKTTTIVPITTYLALEGRYLPHDRLLICLFHNKQDARHEQFVRTVVKTSAHYVETIELVDPDQILHVFDISFIGDDLDKFMDGHYSKMSDARKYEILRLYNPQTPVHETMRSFLFPEEHYSLYAALLNVPESLLREIVELADPYNNVKENCTIPLLNLELSSTK